MNRTFWNKAPGGTYHKVTQEPGKLARPECYPNELHHRADLATAHPLGQLAGAIEAGLVKVCERCKG